MCFRKHRPQLNPHSWWPRTKTKTKSSPCSVISSLSQRVGTLALKSRKGFFFPQMERALAHMETKIQWRFSKFVGLFLWAFCYISIRYPPIWILPSKTFEQAILGFTMLSPAALEPLHSSVVTHSCSFTTDLTQWCMLWTWFLHKQLQRCKPHFCPFEAKTSSSGQLLFWTYDI